MSYWLAGHARLMLVIELTREPQIRAPGTLSRGRLVMVE
jgi:hypothetical protein